MVGHTSRSQPATGWNASSVVLVEVQIIRRNSVVHLAGKDGGYGFFAAKDGSRAFVTGMRGGIPTYRGWHSSI